MSTPRPVDEASVHGLELAVVSRAHVGDLDGQVGVRPAGPGGLMLALNRGSETLCRVGLQEVSGAVVIL